MSPAQAISRDQAPRTRTSKRDLILKTAHDLFLVQGFEGTSIDQIAEAAGVSRQTIYNNFDSKCGRHPGGRNGAGVPACLPHMTTRRYPHRSDVHVTPG